MRRKASKKPQLTNLLKISVILLLFFILAVSFYIYHSNTSKTANWETYTDKTSNFTIQYPNNIFIYRSFPEGGVQLAKKEDSGKDYNDIRKLMIYYRGDGTPEQVLKLECSNPCQEKYETAHINNAVGIRTLGYQFAGAHNYYLINKNNKPPVFRVDFLEIGLTPSEITEFEQIIQTFRFIN